jgi:CheY-like chemotaxis protein
VEQTSEPPRLPWDAWDDLRRPIWLFDPVALRGVYANAPALALWGAASLDELLTRDFTALSPAVRARTERLASATIDGTEVSERWTFYPRGKPVTVQAVISTYRLPDGTPVLLFEAAPIDAEAEERRALEALRHTSTLISLFDEAGRLLFANPAVYSAYGQGDLPLASRLVVPERAQALLARAMAGETATDMCEVLTRRGPRWHQLDARTQLDPVTGATSILLDERDVTETIEAQSARAAAERKAAAAEIRQSFLTEMSHELRTPLNAVLGFSELLVASELDAEQVEQATRIQEGGRRLLTVINEMIRLADEASAGVMTARAPAETPRVAQALDDRATRVLYVDDNEANRRLVVTVLSSQGMVCETATDGSEGLKPVQTGDWDVVLMDIQMPVMDGVAATRAIRALDDFRAGVPVVAVTANTLRTDLEAYAAAGMSDCIEKPVVVATLLEKAMGWATCGWRAYAETTARARSSRCKSDAAPESGTSVEGRDPSLGRAPL